MYNVLKGVIQMNHISDRDTLLRETFASAITKGLYRQEQFHLFCVNVKGKSNETLRYWRDSK